MLFASLVPVSFWQLMNSFFTRTTPTKEEEEEKKNKQ